MVVSGLVESDLVDTVTANLRVKLDASGFDTRSDFNGSKTLRTGSVLGNAPSAAPLIEHDLVVAVANEILLPFCASYQVGSMTARGAIAGIRDLGMALGDGHGFGRRRLLPQHDADADPCGSGERYIYQRCLHAMSS